MSVLADWLVRQAPAWLEGSPPVTPAQRRALLAITRCRTLELGGQVYRCTAGEETDFAYHSCHHRACPRCGGERGAEWTARQIDRLLPVPYFLVTFTVPEAMRPIFAARPEVLHALFFAQAARALQAVAAIPRHLGAELGAIGVLHTWGRQLQYHPHLHFIVPGGGLASERKAWQPARRSDWLLPSKPVAAALRQGFSEALRHAAPDLHAQVPEACWRDGWWVHWQPAGSGHNAVQYLARYVSRRPQRRAHHHRHRPERDLQLYRLGDPAAAGMHARGGRIHAALPATRAAAGPTPRALLRLDAPGGEATLDARGHLAGGDHRRAPAGRPAVVAPVLSALRRLHPRLRRQDPPLPACLRTLIMPGSDRLFPSPPRVRTAEFARRSLYIIAGKAVKGVFRGAAAPWHGPIFVDLQPEEPSASPHPATPFASYDWPRQIQSA